MSQLTSFQSASFNRSRSIWTRYINHYISEKNSIDILLMDDPPVSLVEAWRIVNNNTPAENYWLMTINPKQDNLELLQKTIETFLSYKNLVIEYLYVYEVRNSNGGLHIHVLVESTQPRSQLLKRLDAAATKIFKNESFNVDITRTKCTRQYALKYLLGEKDESKQLSVKYTKSYREKHQLRDFYSSAGFNMDLSEASDEN